MNEEKFGDGTRAFFGARERVFAPLPRFQCPSACTRPCCTTGGTPANVTVFDIVKIAAYLDESPLTFFNTRIELGVDAWWHDPDIPSLSLFQVQWRLGSPCPLLDGALCSVHEVKPMGCRMFPEIDHLYRTRQGVSLMDQALSYLGDYHCFHGNVDASYVAEKGDTLMRGARNAQLEFAASNLLFFGKTPFVVDMSRNKQEMNALMRDGKLTKAAVLSMVRQHMGVFLQRRAQGVLEACGHREKLECVLGVIDWWMEALSKSDFKPTTVYIAESDLTLTPVAFARGAWRT